MDQESRALMFQPPLDIPLGESPDMLHWFEKSAPIRTKFNVLLGILSMLSAVGLATTLAALLWPGAVGGTTLIISAGLATVGTIVALFVGGRLICNPFVETVARMESLAAGDVDSEILYTDHADCVGRMTQAMSAFLENARRLASAEADKEQQAVLNVNSLGAAIEGLARRDLTARVNAEMTGPYAKLKTDFNAALDAVADTITAVSNATIGIKSGADQISAASTELSRRTEQQASSVQENAAAMEQITATVRSTAQAAAQANSVVSSAKADAESSGKVVQKTVTAMGDIERSSNEISEIVSLIDGIAFQTNLLALNAGVEAARAGDAGKGFAVVANEVRALALRSAEAAQNVKTRIQASTEQVGIGVALVDETGASLKRIVGRVNEISELVASIARAADEQASGLGQVSAVVVDIDRLTQQNAAMVEEATAAARALADEADDLQREVARFRLADGGRGAGRAVAGVNPVHALQAAVSGRLPRKAR